MINLKRTAGLWDDMYPHRSARSCRGANSSKSAFSVGFRSCFRWCEAWVGKDVYPRRVGNGKRETGDRIEIQGLTAGIYKIYRLGWLSLEHDLIQSRPLILPVSMFISAKVITSDKVRLEPLSRSVEKGPDSDMSLPRLYLGLLETPNLSPTVHPTPHP